MIIIISGPSGVGKGTIVKKLIQYKQLNLGFSVSLTTRKKRNNEVDGVDYCFVSREYFEDEIKKGNFLEYAKFVNNYYGTSKKKIDGMLKDNKNVLLEIEIEGFKQIIKKINKENILSFFILFPSFEELENRIKKRSSEDKDVIKDRLLRAKEEIKYKSFFDYTIVNSDLDSTVEQIASIIKKKVAK